MGSIYGCLNPTGSKELNKIPKGIKLLSEITQDSYAHVILNNTFTIFKSINQITLLVYCNLNNSIICYNLEINQIINEIKNHHFEYITNFRHFLDKENKRDLIMTTSLDDNNIRIWNVLNWECILNLLNINTKGYLYSACFLYSNNNIYIISSNFNLLEDPEMIKIYNIKGNKISEIKNSGDVTYIVENYYDKKKNKNYIITGNLGLVKSYCFETNELFHEYNDKNNGTHLSILIHEINNTINLIESGFDGNIRLWNFYSGDLLKKIKICKWLTGICLWNNDVLFVGCYDKSIKVVDIKNSIIIKILQGHTDWVLTLKMVNLSKYGKCLISHGRKKDQIKMWIIEE